MKYIKWDSDCAQHHLIFPLVDLLQDGVARRVGEQTEALWSATKPFHKRARYMTAAHWQDNTNQLLWQLSLRKQQRFPVMLESKLKRIPKKIGECKYMWFSINIWSTIHRAAVVFAYLLPDFPAAVQCRDDLTAVRNEALTHGVNNLDAALEALENGQLSERAELSLKAQYVEVLVKLRSFNTLAKEKAVFPLLLPGNAGIHVYRKGGEDGTRRKLENSLARLALALKLDLGVEWDESCAEYKEGLQELAAFVVEKYQQSIEGQVFKRKLLLKDLEQSDSGKNSQKLRTSLLATKKNIEELLAVRESWCAVQEQRSEQSIPESRVRAVCTGDYPWGAEGAASNGTTSAQRHFAQRYRTARCQLKRSEEEYTFLRGEVVRLINWAEERSAELNAELTETQGEVARIDGILTGPPEHRLFRAEELQKQRDWLSGRVALLQRDIAWYTLILCDARKRLWHYLIS